MVFLLGLAMSASLLEATPAARPEVQRQELTLKVVGESKAGRYERIGFALDWGIAYGNPYDPNQVEAGLEIATPSGVKLHVPAFFHQPFEWRYLSRNGRRAEWIYPAGLPGWRVRFAPHEVGQHTATAVVKDKQGVRRSGPVSFDCVAGRSKGYVRASRRDARFFEFSDGSPYFAIGQNVAFIGESQYLDSEKAARVFQKLAENGANFARVWGCAEDWGMAIEARKSAWGRSWDWKPPFVALPGAASADTNQVCLGLGGAKPVSLNVSPSHPVAVKPGVVYRISGRAQTEPGTSLRLELAGGPVGDGFNSDGADPWKVFSHTFTVGKEQWWLGDVRFRLVGPGRAWLSDLSLREAGGGPELLWEADPNRPARGVYNQVDSYLLDRLLEAAERPGIYLQLCLLTRDLYRPGLRDPQSSDYQRAIDDAKNFFRYAVARWGWSPHVFAWEYFNEMDPNAPTSRFYRELGDFLQAQDLYQHLRTVSAWAPAPAYWADAHLDVADLHWYLRPAWGALWKDEVAAIMDRAKLLRAGAPNKPALLAEFGLADDKWGRSPYMAQDKAGWHVHNALWASAFAGLSGTAMFWWWETLDQNNLYEQYRPLATFLEGIPFNKTRLEAAPLATERQSRVLQWQGTDCAYGWIHNPQSTWWNLVAEKRNPPEVEHDAVTWSGFQPGAYRAEWWNTQTGKTQSITTNTCMSKGLRVELPQYIHDLAFKVEAILPDATPRTEEWPSRPQKARNQQSR